jgi:transcriptional regulator with XRE-family HTH domain
MTITTVHNNNPDVDATAQMVAQLVEHRRACKISRTEVARRMGTSRGVVKRLELAATRRGVQMSTYQRYARAVGAPLGFCLQLPAAPVTITPPPVSAPAQRTAHERP